MTSDAIDDMKSHDTERADHTAMSLIELVYPAIGSVLNRTRVIFQQLR